VSSRATTSVGTPRRISPDDHPYRARWRVSSLLHAADRAGADQGSDRRNAAVSVPWPGGLHRSGPGRRARAPGRRGRGQMPGSAGERRDWGRRRARAWCTPTWWAPGWPRHGPCRRTSRWWPASITRCPGRPATTRRGPGMRHGGSTWSSPTGRRPAPGRRGSAWTTAGCATGARRWKACPPRRCRDSPRRKLTFAARLRGDKAPDVLIEALALIDAPPSAHLVGDGPAARRADPADPGPRAGSCRASAGMVL